MLISHLKINMSAYSKTIHYLKDKVHVVLSNWVMKPRYTCFPPRTSLQVPSWPFHSSLVAEHQLIAFRNSLARLLAASAGGSPLPSCCSPSAEGDQWQDPQGSMLSLATQGPSTLMGILVASICPWGGSVREGHFKWPQLHLQLAARSCLRHHLLELGLVSFWAKAVVVLSPPKCGFSFCLACLNEQTAL